MLLKPLSEGRETFAHQSPGVLGGRVSTIVVVRLHLLDATYELFRAYFGFPNRTDGSGREIGAVYGIIETTLSLLREPGVTHLAAATDQVIRSFRNELFPGYKTEEGVDRQLLDQFPLAERALEALGVVTWKMVEFEADDAMATAALRFCDEVEQVVICSPDKDLAQCVIDERVVTFNRREGTILDEAGVIAKFGVPPQAIPDYLALVGDSADGVPGLPGWGAKSTAALLARYGRLDLIPDDAAWWDVKVRSADKLAATLRRNRTEAHLYRTLTTLRRDVPLAESLADLEWQGAHRAPFDALCDELGFPDMKLRPHRWHP